MPTLQASLIGRARARGRALREAVAADAAELRDGESIVTICSALESELAEMESEDRRLFLEEIGLRETGLNRLVRAAYELLGLVTFFTTGENETRQVVCMIRNREP